MKSLYDSAVFLIRQLSTNLKNQTTRTAEIPTTVASVLGVSLFADVDSENSQLSSQ